MPTQLLRKPRSYHYWERHHHCWTTKPRWCPSSWITKPLAPTTTHPSTTSYPPTTSHARLTRSLARISQTRPRFTQTCAFVRITHWTHPWISPSTSRLQPISWWNSRWSNHCYLNHHYHSRSSTITRIATPTRKAILQPRCPLRITIPRWRDCHWKNCWSSHCCDSSRASCREISLWGTRIP